MNWIESRAARRRIRSHGYNEDRRAYFVSLSEIYRKMAERHYSDASPREYDALMLEYEVYRRKAAWYANKIKERRTGK